MRFDILSLFPEMFRSPLDSSLLKKARDKGLIEIEIRNIRDYALDKHRMADDYPYGGGSGMVMKVEPIARALEDLKPLGDNSVVVLLTPQGEVLNQQVARKLSNYSRIVLICGHYEGIDERVRSLADMEISVGDYILTGGELPALIVVDAVSRLVPGMLGNENSPEIDSFSDGLLEYPQYTRPAEFRDMKVPDVLLSGNHLEIEKWRRREALKRTLKRRPDLLKKMKLTDKDREILADLQAQDDKSNLK